jgi:hypothetical protein
MTSVADSIRPGPRELDVRCSCALPRQRASEGRCQLFAGHDGPHAIMFARDGARRVRLWRTREPGAALDADVAAVQRPWMFGYPVPAWFESGDRADVGS